MNVEVAYARPDRQKIISLQIESGTSAESVIARSGILQAFPEIDIATCNIGIFGKVVARDVILKPGDRVEIYRPLIADPKEIRRKRAAEGKK